MSNDPVSNKVVVVTGFGRCGSSLVMQMLHAGGMPCAGEYPAFESEHGSAILADALTLDMMTPLAGRAVKLLDPHRGTIPRGPDYRVIWMTRDHKQQGKSQAKFLSTLTGMTLGRTVARDFASSYGPDTPRLQAALDRAGATAVMHMTFEGVLGAPLAAAQKIAAYAGIAPERATHMAGAVVKRSARCAADLSLELSLLQRVRDLA